MRLALLPLALLMSTSVLAQAGTGYHRAPDAIAKILEAAPTPAVSLSPDHRTMAILGRENLRAAA